MLGYPLRYHRQQPGGARVSEVSTASARFRRIVGGLFLVHRFLDSTLLWGIPVCVQDVVCKGRFTGLDGVMTYIDDLNTDPVIHTWTCKL